MPPIPGDRWTENTVAFRRDPYRFIARQCDQYGTDIFHTRLLLQDTICLRGRAAATLFYDRERFERAGSAPDALSKTLVGEGGVQGLDGEAHRHRKAMMLSLMTPDRVGQLGEAVAASWREQACEWAKAERVVLYEAMHQVLGRAVCAWAGVELDPGEVAQRIREMVALFDEAGAADAGHLWARLCRTNVDAWAGRVIDDVRAGRRRPPEQTAAHVIAHHRDHDGKLLDLPIAAVELVNVLRPVIAVSVFITLAATALHENPECRASLCHDPSYTHLFIEEVRRFYPFFPAVIARVRQDFEWQGYAFPAGTRVMLDIHGTNHDPRSWADPEKFWPERFRKHPVDPFDFIPQGGGDHRSHHRCAGEGATVGILEQALRFLMDGMRYDVPAQDLSIDFQRLPALPRSRFVMTNVRV